MNNYFIDFVFIILLFYVSFWICHSFPWFLFSVFWNAEPYHFHSVDLKCMFFQSIIFICEQRVMQLFSFVPFFSYSTIIISLSTYVIATTSLSISNLNAKRISILHNSRTSNSNFIVLWYDVFFENRFMVSFEAYKNFSERTMSVSVSIRGYGNFYL